MGIHVLPEEKNACYTAQYWTAGGAYVQNEMPSTDVSIFVLVVFTVPCSSTQPDVPVTNVLKPSPE
jgi:hypothetical protein